MNIKMTEPNIQHTGRIVSVAEADRQSDAVKKIMADQKLDYGPAYDVYIRREQAARLVRNDLMDP